MGCDIHLYVEHLDDEGRNWEYQLPPLSGYEQKEHQEAHDKFDFVEKKFPDEDDQFELSYALWPKFRVPRDYGLFGTLCHGVRANYPYSFFRRDLPGNMSDEVCWNIEHRESDGHSHSWITRAELVKKQGQLLLIPNQTYAGHNLNQIASLIDLLPEPPDGDPTRQRLIYFFDN